MVAAHDVGVDSGVFDLASDSFACQPIVDAPADIAGAGICPMRPPGVCLAAVRVGGAERIHKARF